MNQTVDADGIHLLLNTEQQNSGESVLITAYCLNQTYHNCLMMLCTVY